MKKLIFILFTFFISFGAYCQTKYTLPYDSVIVMRPSYTGYLRGAKAGFLDTLFLNNKLKFATGTNGYVLTSDANGNISLQAGGGGGGALSHVYPPLNIAGDSIYAYYNVVHYGADTTGTSDSRNAIQAAINDCFRHGGGVVYFPNGRYKLSGALVTSYNGTAINTQLYIPRNSYQNHNVSITFMGEVPTNFETQVLNGVAPATNGVLIYSTIAGSGSNPSMFAGVPDSLTNLFTQLNYTNLQFYNINFRTKNNTVMSALDLSTFNQITRLDRIKVDIDTALISQANPTGKGTFGIKFPPVNNHLVLVGGMAEIAGYETGVILGEHVNFDFLVIVACVNGISLADNNHSCNINFLQVEGTKYAVVVGDKAYLHINEYNTEHNTEGIWWDYSLDLRYVGTNTTYTEVDYDFAHVVVSGSGPDFSQFHASSITPKFNYIIKAGAGANYYATSNAGLLPVANGGLARSTISSGALIWGAADGNSFGSRDAIFHFDSTNIALGIGTNSPAANLNVKVGNMDFRASVQDNVTPSFALGVNAGKFIGGAAGATAVELAYQTTLVIADEPHSSFTNNTIGVGSGTNRMMFTTASVGIGNGISSLAASAVLDVQSTTQGFVPPRMTTTQKNAISSPVEGLQLYDNVLHLTSFYNGSSWLNNVSETGTQTLTNKRWTARVGNTTSSATPTINTDNVDVYKLTAQAADITSFTTNLSGTPVDGDVLEVQITGTAARAITWGASFVSSTVTLPATTVTTATLTVLFQYYTTSSYGNNKWVCVNYY